MAFAGPEEGEVNHWVLLYTGGNLN
jgi:hypothetical protein